MPIEMQRIQITKVYSGFSEGEEKCFKLKQTYLCPKEELANRTKNLSLHVAHWIKLLGFYLPKEDKIYILPEMKLIYMGSTKNCFPDGIGKMFMSEGGIYTGQFNQGLREGKGILVYEDGEKYDGEWKNDKCHGLGTFIDPYNKATYVGAFVKGLKKGFGAEECANSYRYTGAWKNDQWHHSGTLICYYPNGRLKSTYLGNFENGHIHGTGTLTIFNHSLYNGEFYEGKMHGSGVLTDLSSSLSKIYDGEFQNGFKEGNGTETFEKHYIYTGKWKKNKWHGEGKLTEFCVGTNTPEHTYTGTFQNGVKNGPGTEVHHLIKLHTIGIWTNGTLFHCSSTSYTDIHKNSSTNTLNHQL